MEKVVFEMPLPMKTWKKETILEYFEKHPILKGEVKFTEEELDTPEGIERVTLETREFIKAYKEKESDTQNTPETPEEKSIKKGEENNSKTDIPENTSGATVIVEEKEPELVPVIPDKTRKFYIGTVEYHLVAGVKQSVPVNVAHLLSTAGYLRHTI